jgi:hypothetical protein
LRMLFNLWFRTWDNDADLLKRKCAVEDFESQEHQGPENSTKRSCSGHMSNEEDI